VAEMPSIYFSHVTPAKTPDHDGVPLAAAQSAEIERRVATLDEDIKHAIDADA